MVNVTIGPYIILPGTICPESVSIDFHVVNLQLSHAGKVGQCNGVFKHECKPGAIAATPTLGEWGLIGLSALPLGAGATIIMRRRTPAVI
ncbi:MAG: hypothetical protein LC135_00570 [Phycisphaerae bacterium]|nr:hypothetical protein [Phycisphaerae bacterium]MCZ2398345.1 hypothetical protein [Phycisphaerae bacterium]NUQ50553.1 hypothetical protein [Phycisphaerae bacterium]